MSPGAISCADQIFSNSVVGVMSGAARPTRWPAGRPPPSRVVGEVVGQIGVEGHAVAGVQLVLGAVDVQGQRAALDDGASRARPARGAAGRRGRR